MSIPVSIIWENDPDRALEYSKLIKKYPDWAKSKIKTPSVVGAIIDLGYCLNLVNSRSLLIVQSGYEMLIETQKSSGRPLPQNKSYFLIQQTHKIIEILLKRGFLIYRK